MRSRTQLQKVTRAYIQEISGVLNFLYVPGRQAHGDGYDTSCSCWVVIFFLYRMEHIALYVDPVRRRAPDRRCVPRCVLQTDNSYLIDPFTVLSVVTSVSITSGAFQPMARLPTEHEIATLGVRFFSRGGLSRKIIETTSARGPNPNCCVSTSASRSDRLASACANLIRSCGLLASEQPASAPMLIPPSATVAVVLDRLSATGYFHILTTRKNLYVTTLPEPTPDDPCQLEAVLRFNSHRARHAIRDSVHCRLPRIRHRPDRALVGCFGLT